MENKINYHIAKVGNLEIGKDKRVLIQSMTNTQTIDTSKTVEQIIKIIDAGADIVRVSTTTIKDAENLINIKKELNLKGYNNPIVADIHFNPKIAEVAAKIADKIRINPGNFINQKNFETISLENELACIKEKFIPLIKICKENNTAIRIGVNHGSLSERILDKYGDTPLGMVESALEYIKICEDENFNNIIISLKSSNTRIMVYANRLLYKKMLANGIVYPLHIGVTEAGFGEDGKIKSAVGISTLLIDGIGDTIRVSLTGAPELEIPVAKQIVKYSKHDSSMFEYKATEYIKHETISTKNIGGENYPVVFAGLGSKPCLDEPALNNLGYYQKDCNWLKDDKAVDYIYIGSNPCNINFRNIANILCNANAWEDKQNISPLFTYSKYLNSSSKSADLNFITIKTNELSDKLINTLKSDNTIVLIITSSEKSTIHDYYQLFYKLQSEKCKTPVIIHKIYIGNSFEEMQIQCSCDIGGLLIDGFGNGVWASNITIPRSTELQEMVLNIMQATRVRYTKPEYISCPSCSRTLFDIEKICSEIKQRTSELKNIKIGIMGCIVNGPGEMADADYGYVGSGAGKITLYKGKNIIKQNIPENNAINELIELIVSNGDWKTS